MMNFSTRILCDFENKLVTTASALHTLSATNIKLHPVQNLMTTGRRHYAKPHKNVQYKYDYRVFEDKEYTWQPLNVPLLDGRNPETGLKHNKRILGGKVKFDFYWMTAYPFRPPEGSFYEEKVLEVRCDPNRTSHIALLAGRNGRRWTFAAEGWEAGDIIRITNKIPDIPFSPNVKEIWPVGAMSAGTQVCIVEAIPEAKELPELRAIAAGSSATVMGRRGDRVLIKLANQKEILVDKSCFATVGRVSNADWGSQHWGTMNMKRRMGIKQGSGLWHRKDGYCGRKVKAPPPAMIPERRGDPPPRYKFSLEPVHFSTGFGTNEFNPVLKGH